VKSLLIDKDVEGIKTGNAAVTVESSVVGNIIKGHFIIVKLAGHLKIKNYKF